MLLPLIRVCHALWCWSRERRLHRRLLAVGRVRHLSCDCSLHLLLSRVSLGQLELDLEEFVADVKSVQRANGILCIAHARHGDECEALALTTRRIAHDRTTQHSTELTE